MLIGTKLKQIRLEKRLTLQQLADKASVSVGLLSQIERGISTSTIANIQKIVKALNISFATLFDDEQTTETSMATTPNGRQKGRISVVRDRARKKLVMPSGGFMELLAPVHNHKMEFILIRYPVGTRVKTPFVHEGEECGLVLEGRLKVILGDQEIILEAGDSIYFDSTIPHKWENAGDTEVKFISTLTPPSL